MPDATTVRFVLDGEIVELRDVDPTRTVLQYLREDRRRTGSKEGCAEGDCGACTVVVAELEDDAVSLRAINSCIQFLPTLDGKELITVESLVADGELHPVQRALVTNHASQCGFCTPGFVMSMFALYESIPNPDRQQIDDALAGNLCRCTGYRPIIAAAREMYTSTAPAQVDRTELLRKVQHGNSLRIQYDDRLFFAPTNVDELADVLTKHPDATLLAGGTDVGLWVTKQHRELATIIYTGRVAGLCETNSTATHLEIGGAVTLSDAIPLIVTHYPYLDELFRRFASPPIRNAGTLGGNIANGSPIGDSMAALMVIDTSLLLRCGDVEREVALSDFYHDYNVNDLQPGEFIAGIRLPLEQGDAIVRSHKWSKRFDQDISAVCMAYRLELHDNAVASFRMACGGLAATVKRATATENYLLGKSWSRDSVEAACKKLCDDFAPINDARASANIRMRAAQNLLRRFYEETQNDDLETVYSYGRQR